MQDKITAADIERLSKNQKLQELITEISASSFPTQHFTQMLKVDRSVKALKNRAKGDGGSLDPSQPGEDYLDSVNVPISFLILDTLAAQMADIFFDRLDTFTYMGVTSDDIPGAAKLTQAVNTGLRKLGSIQQMKHTLKAALKHGYGCSLLTWESLDRKKIVGFRDEQDRPQRGWVVDKVLSGCKVFSVPNYRMIRDMTLPPDRLQQGRWAGHWEPMSRNDIIRTYGVDIPDMDWKWLFADADAHNLGQLFALQSMTNQNTVVAHLYVDIIPKDYDLPGDKPEVWYLCLAGRDRILKAEPVELPTDKYPYYTCVPDGDGYDLDPISRINLIMDLIAEFNWLHNSHMYAVRKGIDGDLIVDPSMLDMATVENRDPNRRRNVFQVAPQYYGMPGAIENAMKVIANTNDTEGYAQEAQILLDLIKLISGATDPLIGAGDNPQSRRTAEEIASTKKSASQRLLLMAGNIHDGYMLPLGTACAFYTQHYLDHDLFLRLTKDPLEPAVSIQPEDLNILFDTEVGDEFLTLDKTAMVNSWQTLINTIFANPQLIQSFKLVELLSEFGKAMGIKDIRRFISEAGTGAVKAQAVEQNLAAQPEAQMASMLPPA